MRLVLAVCLLFLAQWVRADIAVIVGINSYGVGKSLKGAVNDAKDVKRALGTLHFDVGRTFLDEQATQSAIMSALAGVRDKIKPTEKFVFYYAGHGLPEPRVLVPSDFDGKNGIAVDQLYEIVKQIRAKSKSATVILDCCFSGGFSKDILTARCYPQTGLKSGAPEIPHPDTQEHLIPAETSLGERPICYVTAAHADQKSIEIRLSEDGLCHGLFTHSLLPYIRTLSSGNPQTWAVVEAKVNEEINRILAPNRMRQDAMVTEEYRPLPPFVSLPPGQRPRQNRVPKNAFEWIQQENPSPEALSITVAPSKFDYLLGEPLALGVSVKKDGYLVVVCCDPDPFLYWPRERTVESAQVKAGEVKDLRREGSRGQIFNSTGDNRVIAYLFKSAEDAERLLKAIDPQPQSEQALTKRELAGGAPSYETAARTFSIAEGLPGGVRVQDPIALWQKIRGTEVYDWLNKTLRWSARDAETMDTVVREDAAAVPILRDRLSLLLNSALFSDELWTFRFMPDEISSQPILAQKLEKGEAIDLKERIAALRSLFPTQLSEGGTP